MVKMRSRQSYFSLCFLRWKKYPFIRMLIGRTQGRGRKLIKKKKEKEKEGGKGRTARVISLNSGLDTVHKWRGWSYLKTDHNLILTEQ